MTKMFTLSIEKANPFTFTNITYHEGVFVMKKGDNGFTSPFNCIPDIPLSDNFVIKSAGYQKPYYLLEAPLTIDISPSCKKLAKTIDGDGVEMVTIPKKVVFNWDEKNDVSQTLQTLWIIIADRDLSLDFDNEIEVLDFERNESYLVTTQKRSEQTFYALVPVGKMPVYNPVTNHISIA